MERKPETEREYGLFIKSVLVDNQLPPFDNTAVARIIEFSSRLVEDQSKLSTRFGKISDLIRESAYWSKKSQSDPPLLDIVTDKAVQRAIDENIYRNNLMEERVQELLTTDTIKIEVTGSVVGQINALSVFIFGDFAFGKPSRLTAAIFPGRAGIIDIERQSKLSGSIHTKGVLILSGFIGQRYGRFGPLNLSASLTFEQSYDEIDGDSASAAEVICLLSAIAHISIRQDIAITGSINQFGIIQAIGGVNEKIEGFYATCKSMELTGTQGVIIPYSNLRNLMLKTEVVQAVEANQFRIWPIKTIDEAIAILSGINPGEIEPDGNYSQGSFNLAVVKNLKEFARLSRAKMTEEVNHENTVEEDVTKSDCDK